MAGQVGIWIKVMAEGQPSLCPLTAQTVCNYFQPEMAPLAVVHVIATKHQGYFMTVCCFALPRHEASDELRRKASPVDYR